MTLLSRPPAPVERVSDREHIERLLAAGVVFALSFRYRLSPDIPVGFLVAAALIPVTITTWRKFRGIALLALVALAAAISGYVLTEAAAANGLASNSLLVVQTARVLGLAAGTMALLWARGIIGTRWVVLVYAIGTFGSLTIAGVNPDNPWKFSYSVPVILLVLSLVWVYGRPWVEFIALSGLGVISALNDSRSSAAMLFIAAALVGSQGLRHRERTASVSLALVRIGALAVGGYYLVQAMILEGTLGEDAQSRSVAQIQQSGSLLLGGRPEIGATLALFVEKPFGYGSGALASAGDILTAKTGMAGLGYQPNNGYVETYMFGYGFQLHSLTGDLWVLFGVAGILLAVVIASIIVLGMAHAISRATASGVLLFLAIRSLWDVFFSPFPSAMLTLMLALAVVAPRVEPGERRRTRRQRIRLAAAEGDDDASPSMVAPHRADPVTKTIKRTSHDGPHGAPRTQKLPPATAQQDPVPG